MLIAAINPRLGMRCKFRRHNALRHVIKCQKVCEYYDFSDNHDNQHGTLEVQRPVPPPRRLAVEHVDHDHVKGNEAENVKKHLRIRGKKDGNTVR